MASFAAVLDACVLIPAALRDTLLRAADAGQYRLIWSMDILAEVQRNLVKQLRLTEAQANGLIEAMRAAFPEANATGYEPLIPDMTNEPKDRHVAAVAVASQAQVIVTSNLKDFPATALAPYDIEALSPDDFLAQLLARDDARMVQVLIEQAQDLRNPPLTVNQVLDMLAKQVPMFATLVRARLAKPSQAE